MEFSKAEREKIKLALREFAADDDRTLFELRKELDSEFREEVENFEKAWLEKAKRAVSLLFDNLITQLESGKSMPVREIVNALDVILEKISLAEGRATQLIGIQKVEIPPERLDEEIRKLEERLRELEKEKVEVIEIGNTGS